MDYIDEVLTNASIDNVSFAPPIRAALNIGKKVLNKYYSLTDASEIYRIAIGMCFCCVLGIY